MTSLNHWGLWLISVYDLSLVQVIAWNLIDTIACQSGITSMKYESKLKKSLSFQEKCVWKYYSTSIHWLNQWLIAHRTPIYRNISVYIYIYGMLDRETWSGVKSITKIILVTNNIPRPQFIWNFSTKNNITITLLCPLLLTWFNFNPSMDK